MRSWPRRGPSSLRPTRRAKGWSSSSAATRKKEEARLTVGDWVEDMQVRLRTQLVRGAARAPEAAAPVAIVSRVPHVRIEPPAEESLGKRCMLKARLNGKSFY